LAELDLTDRTAQQYSLDPPITHHINAIQLQIGRFRLTGYKSVSSFG